MGAKTRFVFSPTTRPAVSHCDRCRVAKCIPNLTAVRQWMQCAIVYYYVRAEGKPSHLYHVKSHNYVSENAHIFSKYLGFFQNILKKGPKYGEKYLRFKQKLLLIINGRVYTILS